MHLTGIQGTTEVTQLLLAIQQGEPYARERLTPLVYEELRRIARAMLRRERAGHTLEATALVHEAYMRMTDSAAQSCSTRAHFLSVAARLMRQILVDHWRSRFAGKRGGSSDRITLDEALIASSAPRPDILAVDEAISRLAQLDARKAQVIEMRYFGGMTGDEIAEALGISTATVTRELRFAQAWLLQHLSGSRS